jgi:hypothetical protein
MSLAGLVLLQVAALGGLVVGRRRLLLVPAAAVPASALLAGVEGAVLSLLALAGLGLGAHLHDLVRDDFSS